MNSDQNNSDQGRQGQQSQQSGGMGQQGGQGSGMGQGQGQQSQGGGMDQQNRQSGRQQGQGSGSTGQQQQYDSGSSGSQFAQQIRPHMTVTDADGEQVGTVDHVDGDRIKLTRQESSDGQHHYVQLSQVESVEGDSVTLRTRGDNDFGMESGN
jgi:hypothetical protein